MSPTRTLMLAASFRCLLFGSPIGNLSFMLKLEIFNYALFYFCTFVLCWIHTWSNNLKLSTAAIRENAENVTISFHSKWGHELVIDLSCFKLLRRLNWRVELLPGRNALMFRVLHIWSVRILPCDGIGVGCLFLGSAGLVLECQVPVDERGT